MGQESSKDGIEMVARQPTWAKKAPRIDEKWFQDSQLGPRRLQGRLEMVSRQPVWTRDGFKMANLGQEGRKDRLQMSKTDNLRQQGSKDRLEMVSRQPTWTKKAPRRE